ncbi:non-specific lipid transfer protein GPI-anchored 20 [Mercurialis annua]|uniref:non-specific lipid transfer protein GPI-anchored 20 n=1 Tax=Mercurialis annua TaxID=3986 RepID=UPI0021605FBD|nr:non-specific lipid transfer protein GPI-anchored 20 [Mercurialis annua]
MDFSLQFSRIITLAYTFLIFLPAHGQITTPCTPSLLASFTPCMNFLTNSTATGSNPTADCCGSIKNLTSNGMDCLCLIVTGSVPFQIPFNRSLALSLPRACNLPGVPVQCKASSSPLPAPGPASLGPTQSPRNSPSTSPTASVVPEPTSSTSPPETSTTPLLTPPSPTTSSGTPTSAAGSRPVLTPPSSAVSAYSFSPSLLLFALACLVLKNY